MKKIFSAGILTLLLAACAPVHTGGKPKVAASFYPLAYLAQRIGGDAITVTQITPGGVEPHDYEPTPRDLAAVENAKVFLMNGGGVDSWADKVIGDLQKGTVSVRMLDTIEPMKGFNEEGEQNPLTSTGTDLKTIDPHVWLDPVLMKKESELIRDALIKADPLHADTYKKNAKKTIADLTKLDAEYKKGLAKCALKNAVTSHNAFRYMAKEYGFTTLAISGISPDQEPSAQRIAELTDLAKKENITVIFFETLVSPKLAQTVADEIGATPMVLNPLEGLTPEEVTAGKDYLSVMRDNLTNLRTALQCK